MDDPPASSSGGATATTRSPTIANARTAYISEASHPHLFQGQNRTSLVKTIFAATALAEEALTKENELGTTKEPPFNPITTLPYNMVRMVVRLTPVVEGKKDLEDLLHWKNPRKTASVLAAYIFLCIICYNYLQKRNPNNGKQPADEQPADDVIANNNNNNNNDDAIQKTNVVDLYELSGLSRIPTQDYVNNLQFLQNFMGIYVDAYDATMLFLSKFDWSNPETTRSALRYVIASIPLLLFTYYFIPINYIALIAGLSLFLSQTTLWRHITFTLPMLTIYKASLLATSIVKAIPIPDALIPSNVKSFEEGQEGDEGKSLKSLSVEVFENQRWWAGAGWAPQMLKTERGAWTDKDMQPVLPFTPTDTTPPAPGWTWLDPQWTVDKSWGKVDSDGWVYTKILLLGSGFVAAPCLNYLLRRPENKVTVAARRIANVAELVKGKPNAVAISVDVSDDAALDAAIAKHDIVISLIPYTHHARVIKSAVKNKKHVVTTSYISPAMMEFDQAAKDAGVTIMNEIGVDPGIDHLYAVKTFEEVHAEGGKILSFTSYCGGLPAPECSNNPLGYKFSWSSRGVLLALRNNAKYIDGGKVVEIPGPELMNSAKPIPIYPAFAFEGYPNRDSTPYDKRYNIPEAKTVIRGTLRYQGFPRFVKSLVKLGLLDDSELDYLRPTAQAVTWKEVIMKLLGDDKNIKTADDLSAAVLAKIGLSGQDGEQVLHGMKWLGLLSDKPVHLRTTLLDTLCATLEEKMMYGPGERDMVMLQHRFEVELKDGKKQTRTSTGLWFGVPGGDSAMATTVGVPCGIATQLILDGVITRKGVLAPLDSELNNPLIAALEAEGIKMVDEIIE
ncbi:hypothetical protein HDV05_008181 [Chytridiales sp. JEL 0842]|nr:hypothetical protein HDV05_008181 [Chytridiales sp. JEL 0842]